MFGLRTKQQREAAVVFTQVALVIGRDLLKDVASGRSVQDVLIGYGAQAIREALFGETARANVGLMDGNGTVRVNPDEELLQVLERIAVALEILADEARNRHNIPPDLRTG